MMIFNCYCYDIVQAGHFKQHLKEANLDKKKKKKTLRRTLIIISKFLGRIQSLIAFNITFENLEIFFKIQC